MDLDEIFAPEVERFGITILDRQPIKSCSFLLAYPWGEFRLKIRADLYGPARLEATAVQIGRIALGHDFKRSTWKDERRERLEWRQAQIWGACRLVHGRLMSRAARQGWEAHELAAEAGVTEFMAWLAWEHWQETPRSIARFRPRLAAAEWLIPQDSLFL